MKNITILSCLLFLSACGGGNSSTNITADSSSNSVSALSAPNILPLSQTSTALDIINTYNWYTVAVENKTFKVTGTQKTRYGTGNTWIEKIYTDANIPCTNTEYAKDPAVGIVKSCQIYSLTDPNLTYNWYTVSSENNTFKVTGTQNTRYGLGNNWIEKIYTDSNVPCTNTQYGRDPLVGIVKSCQVYATSDPMASWYTVTAENNTFKVTGTQKTRYGIGNNWIEKTYTDANVPCTNTEYGSDPAYGVVKSCQIYSAPSTYSWYPEVTENAKFTITGTQKVRYGVDGKWIEKTYTDTTISCSNTQFGSDPAYGVIKSCQIYSITAPVAQPTPPVTPPVPTVSSISFAATTSASIGKNVQLNPVVKDTNNSVISNPSITWTIADNTFATIDNTGKIIPLKAGFTKITAKSGSVSTDGILSVRGAMPITTRSNYVGINLSGIAYWTTEFPFANMLKNSGGWGSRDDSGNWGAAFPSVDVNGYPTALASGQHALAAVAWGNVHYPAGQYVILWDGDGTISTPLTNGKFTLTSAHRATLDMTDTSGAMWVGIESMSTTNPVKNVRFLWPGTESTYTTQEFNPEFLKKINPFSLVRYMDWGATNGSPVVEWADRAHVDDAGYAKSNGVPIEVMIDLANTLHVDPWFCIPHQASNDYVTQFATLIHNKLDPALKAHIEYSNEVWNTGFSQTTWASAQSDKLGLDRPWGTPSLFYAQRSVEMFKIIQGVYGADKSRITRVIAGQAAWTQFLENALAWKDTAANADVMAIAPYFQADGAADVNQVATTLTLTTDQIVDQMLVNIRGTIKDWIVQNSTLAKKYNLKMKAYESGSGNTTFYFPSDKQAAMTDLMSQVNRNPRMHDVEMEYYALWVANSGDTMNQFNDIGGWSQWGFWSVLEYVMQDPASAPRYQGLIDYINAHPMAPVP